MIFAVNVSYPRFLFSLFIEHCWFGIEHFLPQGISQLKTLKKENLLNTEPTKPNQQCSRF